METCGTCLHLAVVGDPKEAINECHRFPPRVAFNDGLAAYPRVKNDASGCGEWIAIDEKKESSPAGPTGIRAMINKARGKALR